MQISLRVLVVGWMIMAMSLQPAAAGWGCGGCGYHGPIYGGCCGEAIVYDDCGCGPCDSCEPCDVVGAEQSVEEPLHEPVPAPPAEVRPMPPQQPLPQPRKTVERPVETAPAPVQPLPPVEEPAEPQDDLFNGSEEASPPPAMEESEPPAEEADSLFGEPAEPAAPAETEPAEEPAEQPAEEPADEPFDLFGTPAESEPEMPAENEEQPADKPEETPAEEDDIFGAAPRVLSEPGGLASEQLRVWVDNTGSYSTRGRMIRLLDGHVQLMKDNGRTTTVPLYRLSASDLEFVHRQASAQQTDAYQTVQSQPATPALAN